MAKRVLIACEESQVVTAAMRRAGVEAYSCDVLPTSGDHPEWHIRGDVTPLLKEDWAMIIAFPPCTDLASSGAKWFEQKIRDGRQQRSIEFFMQFVNCGCERVAIENPIGIMSSYYRKPDQIISPHMFGESVQKKTCLWLKNLPLLEPTQVVEKGKRVKYESGRSLPDWYANASKTNRARTRSKTFAGIAEAMARQYGSLVLAK